MTIEEVLYPGRHVRRIAKTVGEALGLDENVDETTPQQRIAERARKRNEIKREIETRLSGDYASMSVADRRRKKELLDAWALLDGRDLEDKELARREAATDEKLSMRKNRGALGEARADLAKLESHARAVIEKRVHVDETTRQRLVSAISVAQVRVEQLSR